MRLPQPQPQAQPQPHDPHVGNTRVADDILDIGLLESEVAGIVARRLDKAFRGLNLTERADRLRDERAPVIRVEGATRMPYFCSGCPHNTSTRIPEGSRGIGGVGCHYMVTWMDRETYTFCQMGGEGIAWVGQQPFVATDHVFQNLGDGTYFHSGSHAIRAAVSAGINITYKILYNDAVAMTGGQPVDGTLRVDQISHQVRQEGVQRIAVVTDEPEKYNSGTSFAGGTTVHHRKELEAVQKELREIKGVTVLIYDQTCATEKRRRRKRGLMEDPARRAFINEAVCEGCGDCSLTSNCLSVVPVQTEFGRKRAIDQSACTHCSACEPVCPTGAIEYLEAGKKEAFVIGVALFDKDRCLPYFVRNNGCSICIAVCPWSRPGVGMNLAAKLERRAARKADDPA